MSEWLYGLNAVREALRANRRTFSTLRLAGDSGKQTRLDELLSLARERGITIEEASRSDLDKLGDGHQGVALKAGDYPYSDIGEIISLAAQRGEMPFLLLLDTLQDPQNLGALLRTAEAQGVHGVVLPHRRTARVTPAVVNASSGASEHLLIAQHNLAQAIALLKAEDLWVLGLEGGEDAQVIDEVNLAGPMAVVVGSEGQGMRKLVRDSCDALVRLPMRGQIESLNAAVAGSIMLYLVGQVRDAAA